VVAHVVQQVSTGPGSRVETSRFDAHLETEAPHLDESAHDLELDEALGRSTRS